MAKSLFISSIFALFAVTFCQACTNPTVTSKSFTTQDATIVTNIAYISEFDVKCSSGEPSVFYAELDGNVLPVTFVGQNKYQVSWTEEVKTARKGDRELRLFDEDGYTALKKVLRAGEDVSSVSALFTVTVNHPGAYNGPWFNSEFVATILSLVVAYIAITQKSKINV